MRIDTLRLSIAAGVLAFLGSLGCQSAQRPAALLPGKQASAPALAVRPSPAVQQPPKVQADASPAPQVADPKPDPVDDLGYGYWSSDDGGYTGAGEQGLPGRRGLDFRA